MKKLMLMMGMAIAGTLLASERTAVKPDAAHLLWHAREVMAIVHWGPNTFMNQEWGYGNTPPEKLNPDQLDPAQWVAAMAAAEIKSVVLVAKHHDGFCLWPSKFNDTYSMAKAPGANRGRNIVKEVAEACKKHGLKFGVYLSPWDRNRADYARDSYVEYFHNQWREVLTDYGEVCEIWLDGANGGDGWYGGAKERRAIPEHYYQKPRLLKTMHELQPNAVAFGGHGRWSVTWCGNEGGNMGCGQENWWCARPGEDKQLYWQPSEADFPLRQGWFYHDGHQPKSLAWLTTSYLRTVGWGAVMNIGIAPDRHGRVCDADVQRLKEFGDWVRKLNATDYAEGAKQESVRNGNQLVVTVTPKEQVKINCVDLGEQIDIGQRIQAYRVEVDEGTGWREVAKGPTVGWRRLACIPDLTVKAVRVTLDGDGLPPQLKPVRLRWADHVAGEAKRAEDTYPKTGWKIVGKSFGEAERAIDGKEGTLWHTHPYNPGPLPPPQWFAVDMGKSMTVHGFDYLPRQDRCNHGMVDRYEFALSNDGQNWRKVSSGEFGNLNANPVRQRVKLERPETARYFRFTGTHSLDKNNHCAVAEVYVW